MYICVVKALGGTSRDQKRPSTFHEASLIHSAIVPVANQLQIKSSTQ